MIEAWVFRRTRNRFGSISFDVGYQLIQAEKSTVTTDFSGNAYDCKFYERNILYNQNVQ